MTAPLQIVWDWNGTLLDDAQACINALNVFLRERNLMPLDLDRYRRTFGFPVRAFYGTLGIVVDDAAWDQLAVAFHRRYHREPVAIHPEVPQTLAWLRDRGVTQSILSACEQSLLVSQIAAHGLTEYFQQVQGTDNFDGRSKIEVGRALFARLGPADGKRLLIGDTLHDAEVADALGCDCLLVAHGHQNPVQLRRAGCPVIDSLAELPEYIER